MIFDSIIEHLNKITSDHGKYILFGPQTAKLDKNNFYGIADSSSGNKIAFIDGGNAELMEAANFSLQLIRIYYTIYQNNKRIKNLKQEFYVLVAAKNKDGKIVYKIETFNTTMKLAHEFDSLDNTLTSGGHRAEPSKIAETIRKFAELKVAAEIIDELSEGDVLVRDGDLDCCITHEKEYIDALKDKAAKKGVMVCGLSKTTKIITDTGSSVIAALNSIAPEGEWVYPALPTISFAKLHKEAKNIFRIDVFDYKHLEKILPLLKANSKDPCMLGYPYGLIEADRFARITHNEKEQLRLLFMSKGGNKFRNFVASMDAHDTLNKIF
ncbi:MAG: DNA double-strand break repair nuclease NurA [Candidatus Woesearchaeota archaeon]